MGGIGLAGGGIGGIILAIVAVLMGVNPGDIIGNGDGTTPSQTPGSPASDSLGQFVEVVLADTEDTWNAIFPQEFNGDYPEPTLVLFSGSTQSGCGFAQSAIGPFYCPTDGTVYIDLSFYDALRTQLGAPGDFAQAYVIAHEVGHHIQNVIGIMEQVERAKAQGGDANDLSVRTELQADCLAGVWGFHAQRSRNLLEAGDVEEALNAAAAIGDDRLQRQAQGTVMPETFTHGSSAQRVRWFRTGFESGEVTRCDTFNQQI